MTVEMAAIMGAEMQQRFHNNLRSVTAETQVLYFYLALCGQLVSDKPHGLHQSAHCYQFPAPRAKTTIPFAGITTFADAAKPCSGPPDAEIPPPFPATTGLTQLS